MRTEHEYIDCVVIGDDVDGIDPYPRIQFGVQQLRIHGIGG